MFTLYGTEPSYYTAKARLTLTTLGLPFADQLKTSANKAEIEAGTGGYHRFPVLHMEDGGWLVDSTRIGLTLSARVPARSLIPEDKALAILVRMADDWFDEWFLRAAMLFRARSAATRAFVARVGALNLMGLHQHETPTPEQEATIARIIPGIDRFFLKSCATNGVVESGIEAAATLLNDTARFLAEMLQPFLFGSRLSLADASLWGFLETGLLWEPEARAWTLAHAPHLAVFRDAALAAASQEPPAWDGLEASAARLSPLMGGDALGFASFLEDNARAVATGSDLSVAGVPVPARGFTEKCRQDLAAAIAGLATGDRARLEHAIGHWPLFHAYLSGAPA